MNTIICLLFCVVSRFAFLITDHLKRRIEYKLLSSFSVFSIRLLIDYNFKMLLVTGFENNF